MPALAHLPAPGELAWLRDEAGLRPPAIARLLGVAPDAYARWCTGAWAPTPADVPMLPAVTALYARARATMPEQRTRTRWWVEGQREVGWLSPAELLRRGKVGEVLLLIGAADGEA